MTDSFEPKNRIAGEIEGDDGIHGTNPNYFHYVEAIRGYMFATHGHMGFTGDAPLVRLLRTNNGWEYGKRIIRDNSSMRTWWAAVWNSTVKSV